MRGAWREVRGERMGHNEKREADLDELRERFSRLSEASASISESLELEKVLEGVLDNARELTGARYGLMVLCDNRGWIEDYVASGLTSQQAHHFWQMPEGVAFHRHLIEVGGPIREPDLLAYARQRGLPVPNLPFPDSEAASVLAMRLRHRSELVGAICVSHKDQQFTPDDEETMALFATQAAMVITNARRHQQEQRARADLETLVNTAPVGVLVFDAENGALKTANREAKKLVGEHLLPGGTVEDLLNTATFRSPDGRELPADELPLARVLESGEPVRGEEIVVEAPGERSITAMINATAICGDDGAVVSVVMTVEDITPLADLERLRTEFLGMVGHELRMPLTSIKGSASTLLESQASLTPAEMAQFFGIIADQADYMRVLISDLIDIVQIETGTLAIDPEPVDVSRLVDEARVAFLSSGGRDNIVIDIVPDLPLVSADRLRIVQVITNLLTNASRNSHDTSTIRIETEFDGVHVSVSVADDGLGIEPERLLHLFAKFSPNDAPGKGRDMGLGLAICKGIAEAHGGRIWAESDGPGLGSQFTFTIPASQQAAPSTGAGRSRVYAHMIPPSGDAAERILALDDDPKTLKAIRDALAGAGFEPVLTGDPKQLAPLIEQTDPQVVLLDIMLPDTDGLELMHETAALGEVPVIFLSAYNRPELIARAFEMGAVDYLVKPFTPSELAARVRAALHKKPQRPTTFSLKELSIDYSQRSVALAGRRLELTPIEYSVLVELSTNAGSTLTHEHLLQTGWSTASPGNVGLLRTVIKTLRRKLGDDSRNPDYIFTVSRIGYRLASPSPTPG